MAKLQEVVLRDTLVNRPAAGKAGRIFYDTTNSQLQRDNGSSWDSISAAGGATDHGALTGLADDDHPQYATNTEFDSHAARHQNGGADEIDVTGLTGAGGGGISSGTSFPGSPANNDLFYRTDRDLLYFYDGTRWLTVTLYTQPLIDNPTISVPNTTSGLTIARAMTWDGDYDQYLVDFYVATHVVTTNSGSHFWSFTLDNGATGANIATVTTAAIAANTWAKLKASINALMGSVPLFQAVSVKTGSPGGEYHTVMLTYRLVG